MHDPNTVAAIIQAMRDVHGDHVARAMLTDGMTLAALIDTLLQAPVTNRDAVKLIVRTLQSGDFVVTPDVGPPSHLKYIYDGPKSLRVIDVAVMTPDRGTFASTDIRLRLSEI